MSAMFVPGARSGAGITRIAPEAPIAAAALARLNEKIDAVAKSDVAERVIDGRLDEA